MINLIPNDQNSFTTWIIGLGVAGFGALFAFIKWLVGIQVKKIDTLTEKVNELDKKIDRNTTYDKTAKENMTKMENALKDLNEKIDGQIVHAIKRLEEKMKECKYCEVKNHRK